MKKFILGLCLLSAIGTSAQVTSTQLKTTIDANITNRTAANKITPAIHGATEKAIVDFVVQENTTQNTAIAGKASLASPVLTGDPQATAPAYSDSDNSIATTGWVQSHSGIFADSPFNGSGSSGNHLTTNYHEMFARVYQTGTTNPVITFFYPVRGYPEGITVTFTRSAVGVYDLKVIGADTLEGMVGGNAALNIIPYIYGGANIRNTGSSSSTTAGIKTITYTFTNYDLTGTAADGFTNCFIDVKFYYF